MGMKIRWSDSASAELEELFDYYRANVSLIVARKLLKAIIQKTLILESNPFVGVKEPLLSDRPDEYRYLVYKNYKIIYRCNDNLVVIITVFDSRQNPIKLKGLKD
ncbi:MAG TPA: type II toxin-antitoxin system RelE/ParE family toxin [Prolixibacteraceae bacterium]|jgi:plasmid stabilization system protein ParE|nr:type II toxin-antitoxin system RelE/ParE family toxin [Prolixibacteraceae bacterium]